MAAEKEEASYLIKKYSTGALWEHMGVWMKNGAMRSLALYREAEGKDPISVKFYREDGTLHTITTYGVGKVEKKEYFYHNGKKSGEVLYTSGEPVYKGWDSTGLELKNYIVEREAMFPGGAFGWKTYLERNLKAYVAKRSTKKAGIYTVTVMFVITPAGDIQDPSVLEATPGCNTCIDEALRVLSVGPKWIPAMLNNVPVEYTAVQHISFQLVDKSNEPGGKW